MSEVCNINVCVYRNLHKKCWSVKDKSVNRVMAHVKFMRVDDCVFRVSQSGRDRVLKTRCKNVHAGIHGSLSMMGRHEFPLIDPIRISYNPYKCGCFVDSHGNCVKGASRVELRDDGTAWAENPVYVSAESF